MTHETDTLQTFDGLSLFTRRWVPDWRPTRLVVALVHGLHEHSGRYAYLASALMVRGIAVQAVDLRGHGQSPGERGQVETSFDEYTRDVEALLGGAAETAGGLPVVLMGHSMGGLAAARTVQERGADRLAGLVLSSPALSVAAPPVLRAVAPYVARWFPNAPATRVDLSKLSHDPTVERKYREDPLTIVRGVRARLGNAIVQATERVRERPEAFGLPLYLFHGTADVITDPAGTEWLAEHAPGDVTLRLYDGLYHETLHEDERDRVIADLVAWLDVRADAA
ncbi:alpha/beta hydrolase [Rubrivirga sp. S365]|uniref:Lysophospholipase n=1 Tax=Rubrivirga litoralis TaxID=3075598 RepID=A0ABU3BVK1_9BACT|nr:MULTISPECIES: alpha/beta hydrolase [unclassified Rubrivirga]MDT0633260.1 lysophospholipase [Rubrivirga sp. F394]MDT7856882.1 alpha/beta hydrolase [Rubrivirga sp. S365]